MADETYTTKVYEKQGGDELVIASGGTITVESGGVINITSGGALQSDGTPLDISAGVATATDATTAELNTLHDVTAGTAAASKAVVLDANKALDAIRTASLNLGASGSETAVTATAAELNILDGVTATAAELNLAADTSANTEIVEATNVITAAESGKTFFLNSATEFVSTLPAPAQGLRYSFIVTAAPSGASYTIVTNASANIIVGQQHNADGEAGDTGATDNTITFVDGQAAAGDRVEVICDGTNWFAYAFSKVASGVTFTTAT